MIIYIWLMYMIIYAHAIAVIAAIINNTQFQYINILCNVFVVIIVR